MEDYYAGKGQQAGAYTEKPVNAFDNLSEAVSSLREIQKMAQALADRLIGSQPANASDQKLQAVGGGGLIDGVARQASEAVGGGGLIDGVARQASVIREIHAHVYAILSRIENRL